MKITRMKWRNYKGLADGEIVANGHDVIISGRNGTGKSSIAEILPFVMFGKVTGSLKRYDENGLTISDRKFHGAQIEFDNGVTLRRDLTDSSSGGITTKLYVDGAPVQKQQFDNKVETLTNGASESENIATGRQSQGVFLLTACGHLSIIPTRNRAPYSEKQRLGFQNKQVREAG